MTGSNTEGTLTKRQEMEGFILSAFKDRDVEPLVKDRRYDLKGPDDLIIRPESWEAIVQPGWTVTMKLWPQPADSNERTGVDVDSLTKHFEQGNERSGEKRAHEISQRAAISRTRDSNDEARVSKAAPVNRGYWICPACGTRFLKLGEVQNHKTDVHKNKFTCQADDTCKNPPIRSTGYLNLDDRVCVKHIDNMCLYSDCGKVMENSESATQHMSHLHGRRPNSDMSKYLDETRARLKNHFEGSSNTEALARPRTRELQFETGPTTDELLTARENEALALEEKALLLEAARDTSAAPSFWHDSSSRHRKGEKTAITGDSKASNEP